MATTRKQTTKTTVVNMNLTTPVTKQPVAKQEPTAKKQPVKKNTVSNKLLNEAEKDIAKRQSAKSKALVNQPSYYKGLPDELIQAIDPHVKAAQKAANTVQEHLVAIKEILKDGYQDNFKRIVTDVFQISEQHAYRQLNAYKFKKELAETTHINVSQIADTSAALLGAPSTPQAARDEYIDMLKKDSKAPSTAKTKELIQKHAAPKLLESKPIVEGSIKEETPDTSKDRKEARATLTKALHAFLMAHNLPEKVSPSERKEIATLQKLLTEVQTSLK